MDRRQFIRTAALVPVLSGCVTINRYEGAGGRDPERETTSFGDGPPTTQVEPSTTTSSRERRTERITIDEGPTQDTDRIEAAVHWRVNDVRILEDVGKLIFTTRLREEAQTHSRDMAQKGYFAHEAPDGRDFNPSCDRWGENIYRESGFSRGPASVADRVVQGWLESSGHRRNLLDPAFGREGIGAAVASDGTLYVTQTLC